MICLSNCYQRARSDTRSIELNSSLIQEPLVLLIMGELLSKGLRRRVPRYRATANDLATAAERTVAVIGPVADLDEARLAMALREAAGVAAARIALAPRSDTRKWDYRPGDLDDAVMVCPATDTADVGRLLTEVGNRPGERRGVEVFICRDYLVVDYSHGIGDGRFGLTLTSALAGGADLPPGALARSLPRHAAWLAAGRHFGAHPRRIPDVLQLRRTARAAAALERPQAPRKRQSTGPSGARCITAQMAARTVADLRSWASRNAIGATTAAITTALWMAALRSRGVTIDEQVVVLVDCRRYLGRAYAAAHGNFAVGMPVVMPLAPTEVTAATRRVTDSGWPALTLAYAELTGRKARTVGPAYKPELGLPDRVRLIVSDLGKPTMFDHAPWVRDDRTPLVTAYLQPGGADAVTLLISEVHGARTFTASFYGAMVSPTVIGDALSLMSADPVALLAPLAPRT